MRANNHIETGLEKVDSFLALNMVLKSDKETDMTKKTKKAALPR